MEPTYEELAEQVRSRKDNKCDECGRQSAFNRVVRKNWKLPDSTRNLIVLCKKHSKGKD